MERHKYASMPFSYKLARFALLLRNAYPYLGELCMRVEKHVSLQHGLAATDGLRLFLNVEQLNELPEESMNFVLLHELLHIILRHRYPKEMAFYEKTYWNIAYDLYANWLLMSMRTDLSMNSLPIIPIKNTALSSDDLSADPSHIIAQAFITQAVAQGILSQAPPLVVDIEWKSFKATIINDGSFVFDVLSGRGGSEATSDAEINDMLEKIAKTAGKDGLPYRLRNLWDELVSGRKLPWHLILKHYLEELRVDDDYDFSPPDKRMLYRGLIMPSETYEEISEVNNALIVIDVSGSVSRAELLAQIWQVESIFGEFDIIGHIISFGSSVYSEAALTGREALKKFIDGLEVGGGTSWNDVVRYVKQKKQRMRPIIVFTDGYFDSFDEGLSDVIFITQGDYPASLLKLGRVIQIH